MSDDQQERVDAIIKQDGLNDLCIKTAIAIVSNKTMIIGYQQDFGRVCDLADTLVAEMEKRGWLS